jgi:predicted Zn-dependent protease
LASLIAMAGIALITLTGESRASGISFIRDTEIENTIRVFATPLFEAAGLEAADIRIHIIKDPTLNAFVAGGQRLFINSGLLMKTEHAGQIIGVIAHETGHIAGGHLARLHEKLQNSTAKTILTYVLGGVAAVASGNPSAAAAVIAGGATIQQRTLLSYTRTMEQAADQAAVSFLEDTEKSSVGLLEFLGTLASQEFLVTANQDPYIRSHPLTRDRMEFLRNEVRNSEFSGTSIADDLKRAHDRMRAKLKGFLNPVGRTLREFKSTDPRVPARYARAIAYKESNQVEKSLALINGLIAEFPQDPFFHELKGDILQDAGRVADSIAPYRRAVKILPWAALIRTNLAQSLLELNDLNASREALDNLHKAVRYEPDSAIIWRLMAKAYANEDDQANVMLSLAEAALLSGKHEVAQYRATRAMDLLAPGSAGWLRAQDIQNVSTEKQNEGG